MQHEFATNYIACDHRGLRYARSDLRPGSRGGLLKRLVANLIPKRWLLTRGSGARHEFAITFDDGPVPHFTPAVLSILRSFDVRATFYVVGNRAEQFPELMHRITASGHEIASHSHTHPRFRHIPWRQARQELITAENAVRGTGVELSRQVRPPFGEVSLKTLLSAWSMGLTVVLWSVDLKDYAVASSQEIVENLAIANIRDGDIILYHATNHSALAALPAVLEHATGGRRKGVTVSELMRN